MHARLESMLTTMHSGAFKAINLSLHCCLTFELCRRITGQLHILDGGTLLKQ